MSSTYVTVTVAEFRALYPAFADPENIPMPCWKIRWTWQPATYP